jgi:hypothetical protein
MSKGLCQQERGVDALVAVFVVEDGEEDAVHRGAIREDARRPGSPPDFAKAALDGVGGPDPALGEGFVASAEPVPAFVLCAERLARQHSAVSSCRTVAAAVSRGSAARPGSPTEPAPAKAGEGPMRWRRDRRECGGEARRRLPRNDGPEL